ncbi:universal stress protein UspA-like protein [Methanomethylovorans hollandica DSM 15978]|uniref:Universal stress protein UspA-like protein n=1 Tax=Methanomethylovorans hollandica (strain DSM 15978 / NBRC 107637 / DMS1) TaxID=867904 RepID=L0KY47_METHD|nr:universal stress protein [Methanomethylovorans hollandica]AGB50362.1 universal stress protein UspA-like protein [Methanomethylovorans hollandica DSM 15978]
MTAEFKKIFIATDGSEQNRRAIEYSIELAKIAGGKIFVGYVVDTAAFASIPMDAGWEMMYELLETEANNAVKNVEQLAKQAGVDAETIVLEGHPSNEIIDFAQKNGIDVIVMGTLGKSGLDRFLLGSVAEKVTRNSPVPVLVVKGVSSKKE